MDAQEIKQLKELQDAYLSVYEAKKVDQDEDFELWVNDLINEGYDLSEYTWDEMYESYLDEGLRSAVSSAVKRLLGGGKKEAEAPKPESRGAELRRRYNVGPEGSDTSAKRQILNRSRARAERDQERYGDKPFQKQVAQQSKAAHDRYLRAGYSKYGADLPVSGGQGGSGGSGRGSKARKRAAALNREEFEIIVNALVEEGYDLSSYTWNEMYDICLNEIQQLDEPASTNEETDLYDIILSYLLDEGYAETQEQAEVIMVNMSEDWREDIVEKTAMAKRGYDETEIRTKIANSTGGGSFADKATALADQPTFGQRGVDPKARQNLARAQRGDFRKTTSSSPGLKGYAYKATTDSDKAKQAARGAQRGALTPKEKKQFGR